MGKTFALRGDGEPLRQLSKVANSTPRAHSMNLCVRALLLVVGPWFVGPPLVVEANH